MNRYTRHFISILGVAVFCLGASALIGYSAGLPFLYQLAPTAVAMAPGTAWGFCLTGVALWLASVRG